MLAKSISPFHQKTTTTKKPVLKERNKPGNKSKKKETAAKADKKEKKEKEADKLKVKVRHVTVLPVLVGNRIGKIGKCVFNRRATTSARRG